jgi:hypothetical protein
MEQFLDPLTIISDLAFNSVWLCGETALEPNHQKYRVIECEKTMGENKNEPWKRDKEIESIQGRAT